MTNPFFRILKTLLMFIGGKFQFDKPIVGKKIKTEDGVVFSIFRRVVVITRNP